MPVGPIEGFSYVQNEAEIEIYLGELFKRPENRSMEIVHQRAEQITNRLWRLRYINRAKDMLDEYERDAKRKPSSN